MRANSSNIIGISLQANPDTADNVPYLTHQDFIKGVKELNELCDYVALDLTHDRESAGVAQYYRNPKALDKLLREVNKARMMEVGKAAALDFEQRTETIQDYSMSVARSY